MHSGKAEGKTANSVIQKEHPNFLCIHNLKRKKLLTFDFIENREKKKKTFGIRKAEKKILHMRATQNKVFSSMKKKKKNGRRIYANEFIYLYTKSLP